MVIFDTKDNYDNSIKGMLHLNIMDVDYLVSKYSVEKLLRIIPTDYVESFEEELDVMSGDLLSKNDKLSEQYYRVLSLEIETKLDENLLNILAEEISTGNMFTRKQLQTLSKEELDEKIEIIINENKDLNTISFENLYKLRTYKMAKFIIESIEIANKSVEKMYVLQSSYGYCSNENSYKYSHEEYNRCLKNLEAIGVSKDIYESDYFEKGELLENAEKDVKLVKK